MQSKDDLSIYYAAETALNNYRHLFVSIAYFGNFTKIKEKKTNLGGNLSLYTSSKQANQKISKN